MCLNLVNSNTKMLLIVCRTRSIPRGRGRGRGAHTSLDHRPTRLLVSGYESEDWEDVLAHFTIADYTADKQTPALDLVYKTRKDAEAAMLQGRNFRDRVLSVTWSQGLVSSGVAAVTPVGTSPPKPQSSSALEQHELDAELDDLMDDTELIYEDEEELGEEEEELEERSWRR
ncbi:hypothetical protein B566_EDAN012671 [Ephemera danica]|nr:hypothetical protein B566_EDAN012671 [Ephemera danica]